MAAIATRTHLGTTTKADSRAKRNAGFIRQAGEWHWGCRMNPAFRWWYQDAPSQPAVTCETVIPNPKLKLLEQVREVMRLNHYSIRTERTYCDWVRRYVRFDQMTSREAMLPAEPKMEAFLSDLAVRGKVAVSTQNQAFN